MLFGLSSDTICQLNQLFSNSEAAMLFNDFGPQGVAQSLPRLPPFMDMTSENSLQKGLKMVFMKTTSVIFSVASYSLSFGLMSKQALCARTSRE